MQGGVAARSNFPECAQTGWLVMTVKGALRGHKRTLCIVTNHPVCAFIGNEAFFDGAATPPCKGGDTYSPRFYPLPALHGRVGGAELGVVQAGVQAASFEELRVRSMIHDTALFQHEDHIRGSDRRQPMCDHDAGAAFH